MATCLAYHRRPLPPINLIISIMITSGINIGARRLIIPPTIETTSTMIPIIPSTNRSFFHHVSKPNACTCVWYS